MRFANSMGVRGGAGGGVCIGGLEARRSIYEMRLLIFYSLSDLPSTMHGGHFFLRVYLHVCDTVFARKDVSETTWFGMLERFAHMFGRRDVCFEVRGGGFE